MRLQFDHNKSPNQSLQPTAGPARRDDSVLILWTDGANRRLEFQKSGQLSIRTDNKAFPICAVRVCNPDRSSVGINRCDAAPTPTGFAEIVGDDFPILYAHRNAMTYLESGISRVAGNLFTQ